MTAKLVGDLELREHTSERAPLDPFPPDDGRFDDDAAYDDPARPTIRNGTDMARMVNEAIEALARDSDLYVRGGRLTRVVESDGTCDASEKIGRAAGAPVMRHVAQAWLRERLSVCARFMSKRKQKDAEVWCETQPPPWVSAHVIDRGTWPDYRPLVGVVTAPTIRRDGSILQTEGYDAMSGLVYIPRGTFPEVPHEPAWDDVVESRDRLLEVIADFPLSNEGRAAWLALVLTLAARDLVSGSVPLFAVDAPTAGSGKGLLINCAHRIAAGVDAAHMSPPEDEAEFRKQINTTLLAGDPAVLLDNVAQPLGGASIDAVVTAPVWNVRLLGRNENTGALEPRVVWLVTGNGIELVGDLARRTLRIRLEPDHEKPEERTDYTHQDRAGSDRLLAYVAKHRATLVTDALTILRAWHVAGRPSGAVKAWGSFESWIRTIAAAVTYCELPDPSLGRASADAMLDPSRRALVAVYEAIQRLDGGNGVTASELVQAAQPDPHGAPTGFEALAEALEELTRGKTEKGRAASLGKRLKAGRILSIGDSPRPHKLIARTERARGVRFKLEER